MTVLAGPERRDGGDRCLGLAGSRSFSSSASSPAGTASLSRLLADNGETLVAFESPRRLASTLAPAGQSRSGAARWRSAGSSPSSTSRSCAQAPRELAEHFAREAPRGELVLVLGAAAAVTGARAASARRPARAARRRSAGASGGSRRGSPDGRRARTSSTGSSPLPRVRWTAAHRTVACSLHVLLRDHADLLRERRSPSRSRVHDDRR